MKVEDLFNNGQTEARTIFQIGKIVGFVMGAWFLSISLGNKLAGVIGTLTASEAGSQILTPKQTLVNYTSTYLVWGVFVVGGFAIILLLFTPKLNKWMHGIH